MLWAIAFIMSRLDSFNSESCTKSSGSVRYPESRPRNSSSSSRLGSSPLSSKWQVSSNPGRPSAKNPATISSMSIPR